MMSTNKSEPEIYDPATEQAEPVTVTATALTHIKAEAAKQDAAIGIHFGVRKSGCSGYMYVVEVITESQDDYLEFSIAENLSVYVDKKSYPFVKGTTLDFTKKGLNEVFVFHNPNQDENCGCGESFTISSEEDEAS